ncbi:MAG: transcriptional regulator PtsJ [Pseudomonadales bacterium]|nr:transcriptional regulator PtsJ [Pseudomonadales bacterium]
MKIIGKTSIEISDCIRERVQSGQLLAGDSLPSVRELAAYLGVNRNTVAAAYQRLAKAGIAITKGRLGTSICEPQQAGEQEGLSSSTALIDLADGNPNPQWLPELPKLLSLCRPETFLYGDDTILPELRHWAADNFQADCPVDNQLQLTHGAVDAVERLVFAHLTPGDKVAVEDPCFLGTINALRLAGMHSVGIEVDAQGMRPEKLALALDAGVRAIVITPRAHNPTGCSLSKDRARELQQVLAAYPNVLVIIDDHFALLADTPYYSVIPDNTMHWALVRSVSKALGPDLRLAFVVSDPTTADRLSARLAPGMTWVSHILQALVSTCLNSAGICRQVADARFQYSLRSDRLCRALQDQGIAVAACSAGLNLWIAVAVDAKELVYAMAQKGWLVRLGTVFAVQGQAQAIRVTISKLEAEQTQRFAVDLQACLTRLA